MLFISDKHRGLTPLPHPLSNTISAISDDEPLYDSVASDEDYSSIDTQSVQSMHTGDSKGDITAEVRAREGGGEREVKMYNKV